MGDAGRLPGDLPDLLHHFDRALQRGRVGQLNVDDQAALVLAGDEPRGDAGEAEARQADQADVDQEHDRAEAEGPAHDPPVDVGRPIEDPVEAPEELAEDPVHRPDEEPPEHPAGDRAGEEEDEVDPPRQQGRLQAAGRCLADILTHGQAEPGAERRRQEPYGRKPPEEGKAPPRQGLLALVAVVAGLAAREDRGRSGRRHGHGVDGRDDHRRRDGQGELAEELAGDPAQEGAGQEHRAEHQRDGDDRPGDLVHRLDGGLSDRETLLEPALDVLEHDDGVVDHDADGQHQPEQRQVVEREPQQAHDGEGADQGDADVDHRQEERLPVLQEQQDDNGHQDHRRRAGCGRPPPPTRG